jgi:hypothetical protein
MPVIQIIISQGRSVEQKTELVKVLSVLLLQIGNAIITMLRGPEENKQHQPATTNTVF